MLTRLTIRNFKRFANVDIELGSPVVLVGPNNSGKTAALQALALWDVGVKRWVERRGLGDVVPRSRSGVAINRRDLIAVPVPHANLLWRNLHTRDVRRTNGRLDTRNVRVDIIVAGVTEGKSWECGVEFDYANEESIYCRPLRLSEERGADRMPIPAEALRTQIAYLPPMSGLAANETRLDPGATNVRIGEGRTAEVLRNLCYRLVDDEHLRGQWDSLRGHIKSLFGVELDEPEYIAERGEIMMTYREPSGVRLDLSSSGRGLQQTLLLLAYLYANPGAVLLLDEPDAHLEILRQRQTYGLITDVAREQGAQIVAASHSEVVLNEAANKHVVIAFVGRPHRIDDRGSQVLKSLREISYDQYYLAVSSGWVLYLEGSTDLSILQAFAQTLEHPARQHLERPFVHYVGNSPPRARAHFHGLREAKGDLVGLAIYDHLDRELPKPEALTELMWERREIENYLCHPDVLRAYAEAEQQGEAGGPLFALAERDHRVQIMEDCIADLVPRVALRDPGDRYWRDVKASDDLLDRLFETYFQRLELPNLMRKADYHVLARLVPKELIDSEVVEKLDAIVRAAEAACPLADDLPAS
ncbi:MAG: AAA family ATPase [Chloroflexi bacterium]|nr:AAA family ATPase [Chloroflexota bacterium]